MDIDEKDIEYLRKCLTEHLEAAYFGGIEPAAIEMLDIQNAEEAELLEAAHKWGLIL